MSELFDIYDDSLRYLGSKERDLVHRDGDWHQVFHCWVFSQQGDQTRLLLQKRAFNKDTFANHYDISAAGHYQVGETPEDGVRELVEEIGLIVSFEDLIPLGKRISINRYQDKIDREIADVFLYQTDQPLSAFQYQAEELTGLVMVDLLDLIALYQGKCQSISGDVIGDIDLPVHITIADFVPSLDRYPYKIARLIQAYLAGERDLQI